MNTVVLPTWSQVVYRAGSCFAVNDDARGTPVIFNHVSFTAVRMVQNRTSQDCAGNCCEAGLWKLSGTQERGAMPFSGFNP